MAADKSSAFSEHFHSYIFGGNAAAGVFAIQPYTWAISIHETGNDPTSSEITSDWYYNSQFRKSVAAVTGWQAVSGDFSNGCSNQNTVSFDYVPTSQTWNIVYFIVWAISDDNGTDIVNPIYAGQFPSTITLGELQVLQFSPGNFVINP